MAEESESGQEKTEDPTQKKLDDAKKKGQVPRSKDLNSMAIMVIGSGSFLALGSYMIGSISMMMEKALRISRTEIFDTKSLLSRMEVTVFDALMGISPFLFLMTLVALLTPMALGGWSFSAAAMGFKANRINPLSGFKRMFGIKGLIELVKSLLKLVCVSMIAIIFLWTNRYEFLGLSALPLTAALQHGTWLIGMCFLVASSSLILIVAIDVPFQLWDHSKNLKMTLQEVRDEMKDTEGKPEIKSKVRQMQQEMAQRRMMDSVPDADVIITNPTHYAIALKYHHESMAAPVVVAMGKDLIAFRIREIAQEHEVEIFEAPPLARALYAQSELKKEIPGELFFAVAQVLAFVFQLRTARQQGLVMPKRPDPYMSTEEDV
ncbi:MAG: flagellar biosynthetic protein FlhB [Gammaproteobacteria bacterium]|jgi:flagellar biosynthetic protein FlhB